MIIADKCDLIYFSRNGDLYRGTKLQDVPLIKYFQEHIYLICVFEAADGIRFVVSGD